ncbi:MAG: alpha-glucuronidase family glycosyl hydrolase [Armatimonadota bacterium]|nr:alpha-glucuronidase family glycosyl hydrolase [Armatimonadota bacterium]
MRLSIPLVVLILIAVAATAAPPPTVSIRYDAKAPTLEFACSELKAALSKAKMRPVVSTLDQKAPKSSGWTIIVGPRNRMKAIDPALGRLKLEAEGFAIRPIIAKKLIYIVGADARGAMYGALDVAEHVELGGWLNQVKPKIEKPSMPMRALKINLPNWDSLEIEPAWKDDWDWVMKPDYWRGYFRMMARNRYNVCSIWHGHPYAWMARIPKYPEATMLSDAEMDRFQKGFAFIFSEAARHGVDTYMITWNIHYPPKFAKAHNLEPAGQDAPVVRDYMREAIKAVLRQYPGLTGIGTCPGENMHGTAAENEAWLMDTYVPALLEVRGPDRFIHRYWGSEPKPMQEVFAAHYPGKTYLDLKYNGESMYSSPAPHFVDPVWLNQKPRDYEILWHLRNDDLYVYRWGDSSFARETLKHCIGPGIAGYVTGSEYDRVGPDRLYTDYGKQFQTWAMDFEKHWYRFMLWGRLSYNIDLPDSQFRRTFEARFGPRYGPRLYEAATTSSKVLPLVERFHWNYMNFDWAGESCMNPNHWINTARDGKGRNPNYRDAAEHPTNFNDIREWIFNWTIDDDDYIGIPEYVGNLMAGVKKGPGEEKKESPEDVAKALDGYAAQVESALKELVPKETMPNYKEAVSWTWDLRLVALLSRYYAEKTRGGTDLLYYWCTGDKAAQQRSIAAMKKCKDYWLKIVELGDKVYVFPDVSIFPQMRWSSYLKAVDQDIAFCEGPPAFRFRTSERSVMIPGVNNAADIAQFEKQIENRTQLTDSRTVKITEVDADGTGAFEFWLNTMTNRKAGFVNFRTAVGSDQSKIGYFTYPLSPTNKRWCVLYNDFGRVDKVWYAGKAIFDLTRQSADELRKGLVFLREADGGSLVIRCDRAEGQPWGCSLHQEYRDTFTVVSEAEGPDAVNVTIKNNFPQAEMRDVKVTAIPWSEGWQVTPAEVTVNVKEESRTKFALRKTGASDWTGVTVQVAYGNEQHSASDFTPLAGLNTFPTRQDGDGYWRAELVEGKWAMISQPEARSAFIYYDVRDSFLSGIDKDVTLSIEYYDSGVASEINIDYDSHLDGPGDGAFHRVAMKTSGQKGWQTQTIALPRAKFKNREQGMADFRLSGSDQGTIRVGRVEVLNR